jgi:hypothetical protein
MCLPAHRLKWVNTFAMAERWKEESIRVYEEMRRLAAWHEYMIGRFERSSNQPTADDSWIARGQLAIQHELLNDWKQRFEKLPQRIRQLSANM